MELSWIQKHVLLRLIRNRAVRVKDLQPADIPANQFAYHLDGLASRGLIFKLTRGTYALTPKGERLAGTFSTALNKQAEYLKTSVVLYGRLGEEYLLFRWSRQPYLGYATPPHDHIPRGKLLSDGINSALDDKLGIRVPATYKTSALIKIFHDEECVSHINAFIYEVSIINVQLPKTMRNGEVFVGMIDEIENVMDGVADFLRKIETADAPFDAEWRY